MARPAYPCASSSGCPLCRSVATAAKRMGKFSIRVSPMTVLTQLARLSPRMNPPDCQVKSSNDDTFTSRAACRIFSTLKPLA
ncbi:hypothetical protein D9M68_912290 [compost metagenome]